MAASSIYSAKTPDMEQSSTTLNEPSMEDILASIRRIIAEDQSNSLSRSGLGGLARRAQPTPAARIEPANVADVIPTPETDAAEPVEHNGVSGGQPTPPVAVDVAEPQHGDTLRPSYAEETVEDPFIEAELAGASDLVEAVEAHHAPADEPAEHEQPSAAHEPPVAHHAHHMVELHDEAEALISPDAGASISSSFQALANSVVMQDPELVERVMRETLRPMLKTWLDDHLPSIVERLVRTEIERVARGGRSRD